MLSSYDLNNLLPFILCAVQFSCKARSYRGVIDQTEVAMSRPCRIAFTSKRCNALRAPQVNIVLSVAILRDLKTILGKCRLVFNFSL